MGIDGISKPGGGLPPAGVEGAAGTSTDFADQLRTDAAEANQRTEASSALRQLDAGTLTVDEYLEQKVNEAIAPFESKLPAEQLDFVRESLRAQLKEDPVLIELVRRTTGSEPR